MRSVDIGSSYKQLQVRSRAYTIAYAVFSLPLSSQVGGDKHRDHGNVNDVSDSPTHKQVHCHCYYYYSYYCCCFPYVVVLSFSRHIRHFISYAMSSPLSSQDGGGSTSTSDDNLQTVLEGQASPPCMVKVGDQRVYCQTDRVVARHILFLLLLLLLLLLLPPFIMGTTLLLKAVETQSHYKVN